jgi:hypothetical protein
MEDRRIGLPAKFWFGEGEYTNPPDSQSEGFQKETALCQVR